MLPIIRTYLLAREHNYAMPVVSSEGIAVRGMISEISVCNIIVAMLMARIAESGPRLTLSVSSSSVYF